MQHPAATGGRRRRHHQRQRPRAAGSESRGQRRSSVEGGVRRVLARDSRWAGGAGPIFGKTGCGRGARGQGSGALRPGSRPAGTGKRAEDHVVPSHSPEAGEPGHHPWRGSSGGGARGGLSQNSLRRLPRSRRARRWGSSSPASGKWGGDPWKMAGGIKGSGAASRSRCLLRQRAAGGGTRWRRRGSPQARREGGAPPEHVPEDRHLEQTNNLAFGRGRRKGR